MQSRNKKAPTKAQASHIAVIKALPCSVCDEPGPSDAHEIKQGQWFTAVALCKSCHQGPKLGLHGEKGMWRIRKMDEMDALAKTIERVLT
jgi:hypothetical protein